MAESGDAVATVREVQDEHGYRLVVSGRLDVRSAADLRLPMHRAIASGSSAVLLDLGDAHIGDATGFGLVVEVLRRAHRAGRALLIVAADDRTRRLLRRARLGSFLAEEVLTGAVG